MHKAFTGPQPGGRYQKRPATKGCTCRNPDLQAAFTITWGAVSKSAFKRIQSWGGILGALTGIELNWALIQTITIAVVERGLRLSFMASFFSPLKQCITFYRPNIPSTEFSIYKQFSCIESRPRADCECLMVQCQSCLGSWVMV